MWLVDKNCRMCNTFSTYITKSSLNSRSFGKMILKKVQARVLSSKIEWNRKLNYLPHLLFLYSSWTCSDCNLIVCCFNFYLFFSLTSNVISFIIRQVGLPLVLAVSRKNQVLVSFSGFFPRDSLTSTLPNIYELSRWASEDEQTLSTTVIVGRTRRNDRSYSFYPKTSFHSSH